MKKSVKKTPKSRNAIAASLASPVFKPRVVKDPTIYTRKVKHKSKSI